MNSQVSVNLLQSSKGAVRAHLGRSVAFELQINVALPALVLIHSEILGGALGEVKLQFLKLREGGEVPLNHLLDVADSSVTHGQERELAKLVGDGFQDWEAWSVHPELLQVLAMHYKRHRWLENSVALDAQSPNLESLEAVCSRSWAERNGGFGSVADDDNRRLIDNRLKEFGDEAGDS